MEKFVPITSIDKYPYFHKICKEYCTTVIKKDNNIKNLKECLINVPMDVFKESVICSINRNISVPATTYYSKNNSFIYDIDGDLLREIFDIDFYKRDRSRVNLNHAMAIVGYNSDDKDNITRYKLENSHGNIGLLQGHVIISDKWFDKYIIELIVHKDCIPRHYNINKMKEISVKFWH